jgi:glycosyltransferase involved in cell wall biosynthesis
MKLISLIIPAYNEELSILNILEKVNEQVIEGFEFEVLVIDDGSSDNTVKILKQNAGLYTKLIEMNINGGKGAAVQAGLRAATGEYILFQDADMEYDPADYANLLTPITRFDADIVMGSRLVASQITRVAYFWNRFGNRVITLIFNILNNSTFTDIYSCYLLYRRSLVNPDQLRSTGWEQHAEILSISTSNAKAIYEVPINYYGRTKEEGKKIRAYHIFAVIWMIVKKRLFK